MGRSPTDALRRRWTRMVRNPFDPSAGRATLVHCGHHRVGTRWFHKILADLSRQYGLSFASVGDRGPSRTSADVVHFMHGRNFSDDVMRGRPFRGSHLVRDPRDIVVSAYHYHLWTEEPWARRPDPTWGGASYQEHLNSLSTDDGIAAEIRRTCDDEVRDMRDWNYDREEFLELRYEELMADEQGHFARLFRHYGLSPSATEVALGITAANSFAARSGRTPGQVQEKSHLRSGQPGEWRSTFTDAHVELFKELANDVLVKLGYERDGAWGLAD